MKYIIYAIAAVYIAFFIFLSLTPGLAPALQEEGRATLAGLVLAVCLIPSLVLTIAGRAPFLSFLLVLIPGAIAGWLYYNGFPLIAAG